MNTEQKTELFHILAVRRVSVAPDDMSTIKILLKELARRLLNWTLLIKNKNPDFELGPNILFDVAFSITGNKIELPNIRDITLSHFDRLMLASYFNWKKEQTVLKNRGYDLPNPYSPYIAIFKLGGHSLKYEYTKLEIYPFWGINVFPIEDFLVDTPFWVDDSPEIA
jgi:hypothetical protein